MGAPGANCAHKVIKTKHLQIICDHCHNPAKNNTVESPRVSNNNLESLTDADKFIYSIPAKLSKIGKTAQKIIICFVLILYFFPNINFKKPTNAKI